MKFDENLDRETRVRIWDSGINIGTSWVKFGDSRQKQQQIKARGTPQSLVFIRLMLGDVCGLLSDGELIAMGYRVQPYISDGPTYLPADSFSQGPDDDELMSNTVIASGWKYERVRVLKREDFLAALKEAQELDKKVEGSISEKSATEPPRLVDKKRGGGRISIYRKAEAIFKELFEVKPHLKDEVAAKIAGEFNQLYKKNYFPDGKNFAALSERTIRKHLKTYRK